MKWIATSLEKFATEIRGLQKSEMREVEEAFAKGQKGSSAMPHKRNPIGSENICGLARVIRGHMLTSLCARLYGVILGAGGSRTSGGPCRF